MNKFVTSVAATVKKWIAAAVTAALIAAAALCACFAFGLFDGRGVSEVSDKDYTEFTYSGELKNGRFDGYGTLGFQDGLRYTGNFADGRFSGKGEFSDAAKGWNFTGVFADGQVSGGVFRRGDGGTVTYTPGAAGSFTFADGSVYTGGFLNGLAEGEGAYTDASGRIVYQGGFKQGQFDGWGVYFSPAGWSYAGWFKNGLFDGEGLVTEEEETIRGVWADGKQVTRYESD
ncbi:MAG: hypothetical protein FWC62_07180 [Firmicutes bacterium]|nr:hypothetical protein [Bacillota bacterium]